ncbi:MAG: phytanoyl-CoA dioxygenase family protein [Chloroflexi bacterium]|nr:phytanoyl-CoA dioxygenase family protein [Chloroflexota bacterium]
MNREDLYTQISEPYTLPVEAVENYRRDGYVKLKDVLSAEVLAFYGEKISELVQTLNKEEKPLAERSTYRRAFLQIMNLWTKDDVAREFVFSRRLARIAAELMGVAGVRMYHDQALYKEPGGGYTPWHVDQFYWPLSNANSVTVWVPLQKTPLELGPLAFCVGSHVFEKGRDLAISDESEEKMRFNLRDFPIDEGPYDLGEVSFHAGWTFHRAGPNTSVMPRAVMTVIYIEDGIRLSQPRHKNHENDWNTWMPGVQIGAAVDSPMNPVLYRAE